MVATVAAFSPALAARSPSVLSPRAASQQSNGLANSPQVVCTMGTRCQAAVRPHSSPSMTSLCPFMIFVMLSITKSAPQARG